MNSIEAAVMTLEFSTNLTLYTLQETLFYVHLLVHALQVKINTESYLMDIDPNLWPQEQRASIVS
jgi:hypothetical protein